MSHRSVFVIPITLLLVIREPFLSRRLMVGHLGSLKVGPITRKTKGLEDWCFQPLPVISGKWEVGLGVRSKLCRNLNKDW